MSAILVLRVERPYANESDLLLQESWTIAKKSVFLIGIPPHAEGTRVRCELVLESGEQLLVAEGVVSKHMAAAGNRPPGLVVRFRRMSAKSSQFVSRALGARETTEASSPSAAENPPLSSEIGGYEPPSVQLPPVEGGDGAAAQQFETERNKPQLTGTTTDALRRLASRNISDFPIPDDRESVLARLRSRMANAGLV